MASMDKHMDEKQKIIEQLNEIYRIVENEVHPVVSPDNWHIYSHLRDEIDLLALMLKENNMV